MAQQYNPQTIKSKTSLLIFLKGSVAPIVLYFDDPKVQYENLKEMLKNPAGKMIELEASGPIKKVNLIASEISGLALQEEQYVVKP